MITFTDLDFDLEDLAAVFLFHDGDLYPGFHRTHRLWAAPLLDAPPYSDAYVLCAPRVQDDIIVRTALQNAQLTARRLAALPNVVQDLCFACHPDRRRPNRPRWFIYHAGPYRILTPCIVVDELYPP